MYNFKALECFIAVAEMDSFKLAAGRLNRSQSAVSMQIRLLEEQLGVPLFHRTTRKVRLTRQGEILLTYARRAIHELDTGLEEVRRTASVDSGEVAMACIPSIASSVMPKLLKGYKDEHPNIHLNLREMHSEQLLKSLRAMEVDFAVGAMLDGLEDVTFRPLVTEEIVAVATTSLGLPDRPSLSLGEVMEKPIILISPSASLRSYIDTALERHRLVAQESFEVTNVRTMLDFAEAGLGSALIPLASLPEVMPPDTRVYHVSEPALQRTICHITLRGTSLTPFAQGLMDRITRALVADPRFRPAPPA